MVILTICGKINSRHKIFVCLFTLISKSVIISNNIINLSVTHIHNNCYILHLNTLNIPDLIEFQIVYKTYVLHVHF